MYLKSLCLLTIIVLLNVQCKNDSSSDTKKNIAWVKPQIGAVLDLGDKLPLQLDVSSNFLIDSVVYLIDTASILKVKDAQPVSIATDSLALGNRLITARVFSQGQVEEISTNIVLKSTLVPQKLTYKVVHTFPHDTSSYIEGLEYHKGFFYESAGEYGKSSLRKVDIVSGRVLQKTTIRPEIFAEGITIIGDKILQLTYQENIGIVYDLATLKPIKEFACQSPREGWGLCNDGKIIYNTDGSNVVYFLNKDTFRQQGYIEVYDHNGPVNNLNELEYIDGKLYANVFTTDRIVVINPHNGQVTAELDLSALYPASKRNAGADVLNGIAWDKQGQRLFVTGKKWDKLFQITCN